MKETRVCPKCMNEYSDHPTLSREDNATEICPECGIREAVLSWLDANKPIVQIAVVTWKKDNDVTTYKFTSIDEIEKVFPREDRNALIMRIDIVRINVQTNEPATTEPYFIHD